MKYANWLRALTGFAILALAYIGVHAPASELAVQESPTPETTISISPTATALPITSSTPEPAPLVSPSPSAPAGLSYPIADFTTRITKKTFGQYITPATSPVQPERFTGYHTGVDIEYGDVTTNVPVLAVADGSVVMSQWVSGYGGLLVEQITYQDKKLYILYGHLRASSLVAKGTQVQKGQPIAVLGTAYSQETDGERRHLHFAVYTGATLDIRGYVQNKSELSNWEDPRLLFPR